MLNIIKVIEEALEAFAHDVTLVDFHDGHLSVNADINVGGNKYQATLTIDEEVPETPLTGSDG